MFLGNDCNELWGDKYIPNLLFPVIQKKKKIE